MGGEHPGASLGRGRTLLVVAAHADDETLGAGGTMAALQRAGWTVDVVVLCDGLVDRAGTVTDNVSAAASAAAILGVRPPRFLGFPDQRLHEVPFVDLTAALGALPDQPDVVITHDPADLNGDHRLTLEAVLVRWRPTASSPAVLGMEVVGSTGWGAAHFEPSYYVDVAATLDAKARALQAYEGELRTWPHPRSVEGIRAAAAYHGMNAGVPAAEAFRLIRARAGQLP